MSSSHSAAAPTQACTRTGTLVRKEDKQKPRSDPETKTCPVWCDADCKWQLIIYIVDTRPFIPKHPRMLSNTGSKTEGGVEEERWREAEHRDSGFLFFSFLFWSHPALRSHRRAGMNTKCSKFHHFHFIWETKNKAREQEIWLWRGGGWRGGERGTHSSNYPCPLTAVCAQRPVLSHMCWIHLHQRHLFKQNSFLPLHRRLTSPTHDSQDLLDDLNLLQSLYL